MRHPIVALVVVVVLLIVAGKPIGLLFVDLGHALASLGTVLEGLSVGAHA